MVGVNLQLEIGSLILNSLYVQEWTDMLVLKCMMHYHYNI